MSETIRNEKKSFEEIIRDNICANIRGLIGIEKLSQHEFAELTGISVGALNGYINKKTMPDILYISKICAHPRFKKYGFSLDDFVTERIEFERVSVKESPSDDIDSTAKKGYIGTYLVYIFDQSKIDSFSEIDRVRELRYGVISVFEQWNLVEDNEFIAFAKFYKSFDSAVRLKSELDELPIDTDMLKGAESIRSKYQKDNQYYSGKLEFTKDHTFVNLSCPFFGDHALMAFHAPRKKGDTVYIGGVGCVTSISRGRYHMPAAQKIIISRYTLKKSDDEIAKHLQMNHISISMKSESDALISLLKKLYVGGVDGSSDFLDEQDKRSIFEGRLNQIVRDYLENNLCGVGCVSNEDDDSVYDMIKSCIPDGSKERLNRLLEGSSN